MTGREAMVAGALANKCVQQFRSDPRYRDLWTDETLQLRPVMRVEFEHAVVLGTASEAVTMREHKNGWGEFVRIMPLKPTDQLHPFRIVYMLKDTSKQRQKWEFRDTFKNILGSDRRLVKLAMQNNKKEFVARLQSKDTRGLFTAEDATIIREKLDIDPAEFWERCRHGDKYGPGAINEFVERLQEKVLGYTLKFD